MARVPALFDRGYQEIVDEALARIPVHNPEWTNFNRSDPGVTLIELFAFLLESVAYRADQIPERNRHKFLSILGAPPAPASSARGIVAFQNERGPLETVTVGAGIEVGAGSVPFRTRAGLDILPVEARPFLKRRLAQPSQELIDYYRQLYATYTGPKPPLPADPQLYETVPLEGLAPEGAAIQATADRSLWIALLLREIDPPASSMAAARDALAGKTLSLGIVPVLADPRALLRPGAGTRTDDDVPLDFEIPEPPPGGALPSDPAERTPRYRALEPRSAGDLLAGPRVIEVTLPGRDELGMWTNLEPLEEGVGDFPPAIEDTKIADRVITWLRVKARPGAEARVLWAGINAAMVSQRTHVAGELLGEGTGEPDQRFRTARSPVIPESIRIRTRVGDGPEEQWRRTDELLAAGPEVPVGDPRLPPGSPAPAAEDSRVFALDGASGEVTFGDGSRGARPPRGATVRADYDFGAGAAGNVGRGEINTASGLPAAITVENPVPTWGGAEPESVDAAEKQAARYLQHRDRVVTKSDFETIARRAPGVEIGRVEALPAFNPDLAPSRPGDAAGAVTLLTIPRSDPAHPDAPEPDQLFLDAVCAWIGPRRLVTTEVFVRGPVYKDVWVSLGIEVEPGESTAAVREAVRAELVRFLAPIDPVQGDWFEEPPAGLIDTPHAHPERGWPLGKPVLRLELIAVANRVRGVRLVTGAELAEGSGGSAESVPMSGLELPRARGIAVGIGPPPPLRAERPLEPPEVIPVPLVPETC